MYKIPPNIAEAIKMLRQLNGLTQTELADLTGVKQATIAGYEAGRTVPKSDFRREVKKKLNVDLDDLESITNVIPADIPQKRADPSEDPYKDKYIGLLEKQVSEQRDIKEHLVRLEANLKVIFEDQLAATKRVLSGQDNILRKLSDVSADRSKRPASGGKQLHKDKSGKGK